MSQLDLIPGLPPAFTTLGPKGRIIGPRGGPRYIVPRGYAAAPGTGPTGETCGTCRHYCQRHGGSRSYPKCGLMRAGWTHGPKTDIRARASACSKFEPSIKEAA